MSKPSILIYGPSGCGKSTNASSLVDFYGLESAWDECTERTEVRRDGVLFLAERVPSHWPADLKTIPFTVAIKEACLASWKPKALYGLGISQIVQILGIDAERLIAFTLHVEGRSATLTVKQRPPESQSAGYLTRRFNLVEIGGV